jgi:hypothetical protein
MIGWAPITSRSGAQRFAVSDAETASIAQECGRKPHVARRGRAARSLPGCRDREADHPPHRWLSRTAAHEGLPS